MSDKIILTDSTKIQWTITIGPDGTMYAGFTFNPWIGCSKVSPGCKFCYAEVSTPTRVHRKRGLELWGVKAARYITSAGNWAKPRAWNRLARKLGIRLKVFCASLADVFEDRRDIDAARAALFKLIEETPFLDWLLVTKRPECMVRLAPPSWAAGWPVNVWAGASVEDRDAEARIDHLLLVPAKVLFLSCEPLLEAVDLSRFLCGAGRAKWVIVGGESGDHARPFDPEWARDIMAQVKESGHHVFMKQYGSKPILRDRYELSEERFTLLDAAGWTEHAGPPTLADDHGGNPAEWPLEMRVREFPASVGAKLGPAQPSLFGPS